MKKLILAAGFIVAATSASFAQVVYSAPGYGYGPGYYDYAPGYGTYAYGPGYYGYGYDRGWWSSNDTERGGPGPRAGAGGGLGVGAQR